MFFVDRPYVSEFLKRTLSECRIPVVGTAAARRLDLPPDVRMIGEDEAIARAAAPDAPPLYMTSENAIGWLARHPVFAPLCADIDLFKNKLKFRERTAPLFPDFFFKGVAFDELRAMEIDDIPLPVIIKPAVGFFSMGVHRIGSRAEWTAAIEEIAAEIVKVKGLYPPQVLNAGVFLIEQCIEGEEFAIDAYFDAAGQPVILGIFQHAFASESDVSDRVYMTSKPIVTANLAPFTEFLRRIGDVTGIKRFPVHVELRRDGEGRLLPIEVNPMRFGGWCTTADLTSRAFGFNPYVLYAAQQKPDWDAALSDRDDSLFCIVVLDNSTGLPAEDIAAFDYDKMLAGFEHPLELRRIDHTAYPVFGFVFTETRANNFAELRAILDSDLREFVIPA